MCILHKQKTAELNRFFFFVASFSSRSVDKTDLTMSWLFVVVVVVVVVQNNSVKTR